MIIRELNWERDGKSLTEFDASFTTEYIYRPTVGEMSFELTREELNIPLHKNLHDERDRKRLHFGKDG